VFGEPPQASEGACVSRIAGLQVLVWWMFDVSTGENIDLLCMPPSRRAVLATTGFTSQYYTFLENDEDFIGVRSMLL